MSPASIRVQRRIEWSDTDASGYYHNSAAFRLIEVAETALLDRLGILDEVYGRLPRAHISADFLVPLRHRDLLDVRLEVQKVGRTSISYGFEMLHDGAVAVRGTAVAVLLDRARRAPTPWPDQLRETLLSGGEQPGEMLVTPRSEP